MTEGQIRAITIALYYAHAPGLVCDMFRHGRGVCGLVLVESGEAEYRFTDGHRRILRAGDAALFSPDTAYTFYVPPGRPFAEYTINFTWEGVFPFSPEVYGTVGDPADLPDMAKALLGRWNSEEITSRLSAMGILYHMLSTFLDERHIGTPSGHTSVLPAIRQMEDALQNHHTIASLSALCAMSETHFRRIFRETVGVSPMEYLIRLRIKRGMDYVIHSTLPLTEIATLCGFSSAEYFSRQFRRHYGLSPGQFRRQRKTDSIAP